MKWSTSFNFFFLLLFVRISPNCICNRIHSSNKKNIEPKRKRNNQNGNEIMFYEKQSKWILHQFDWWSGIMKKTDSNAFKKYSCDSTEVSIRKLGSLISDFLSLLLLFGASMEKVSVETLCHKSQTFGSVTKKKKRTKTTNYTRDERHTQKNGFFFCNIRFNAHKVILEKYLIFHSVGFFLISM